jgi:hypothetical protein
MENHKTITKIETISHDFYSRFIGEFNKCPDVTVEKYETILIAAKAGDVDAQQKMKEAVDVWPWVINKEEIILPFWTPEVANRCVALFSVENVRWVREVMGKKDCDVFSLSSAVERMLEKVRLGAMENHEAFKNGAHTKIYEQLVGVLATDLGRLAWMEAMRGRVGKFFKFQMQHRFHIAVYKGLERDMEWCKAPNEGLTKSVREGFSKGVLLECENAVANLNVNGKLRCIEMVVNDKTGMTMQNKKHAKDFKCAMLSMGRSRHPNNWLQAWGFGQLKSLEGVGRRLAEIEGLKKQEFIATVEKAKAETTSGIKIVDSIEVLESWVVKEKLIVHLMGQGLNERPNRKSSKIL